MRRALPIRFVLPAALAVFAAGSVLLFSQTIETAEMILKKEFPGTAIERKTLYLTREEGEILSRCCGESSRVHTFYLASDQGGVKGFGIFDTHVVRTKEETLFIVVDAAGIVKHVQVAAFLEPRDYLAPDRWFALFKGKTAGSSFDQPPITGATLTVKAAKNAVRRALELHRLHARSLQ